MKSVIAITLNWNRCQDTLQCVSALAAQTLPGLKIIVVDNASTDGSPDEIARCYPQVEQIINEQNLGFGRGFNIGIRRALEMGADHVFIINNDAWVEPRAIEELVRHSKEDVGILAPMIYYADEPGTIWSAGGLQNPLTLEVKHLMKNKFDSGNWPDELDQDFVTGCAVLLPRQTCEQVGLFDEDFHAYYEDMDYSRRVRKVGLRIVVVPKAHAWHKVSMSSGGSDTPNERYWMARSSLRYFSKHAEKRKWPVIFFFRLGSSIKITLRLLLLGRFVSAQAYWRGIWDGVRENLFSQPV